MEQKMSIKLNLTQLVHARITSASGKDCIVIPVEANHLYASQVGNLYLDLIAWPLKTTQKDQTHIVKQSLPKEVRDKMTPEQQKELPIIGNLKVWDDAGHAESAPAANSEISADVQAGTADLPF